MKEIGGYLELDQLIENPYHKDAVRLNTGRNALLFLVKAKQISKLFIPYYLCDSVSDLLHQQKIDFDYYHIDKNFNPIFREKLNPSEYLYIVNHFGQLTNEDLMELKHLHGNIIVDNTQAFFQKPDGAYDTLYSCRKFFGVPDGAYLYTDSTLNEQLDRERSSERMTHILGRFEGQASDYYSNFQENDDRLEESELKLMSKLTENILGAIDYEKIRTIRNENFQYLHNDLGDLNGLEVRKPEVAFFYPFYIRNGAEIRKRLIEKKIYIPVLWPNVLTDNEDNSLEYQYALNILPLPCDQRYSLDDMRKIIEEVKKAI